uniref:Uncharacterized protein n=1 Tax=Trichogramma kaykai TaxID=54128 RepID=A0ABD2WP87_9HYME
MNKSYINMRRQMSVRYVEEPTIARALSKSLQYFTFAIQHSNVEVHMNMYAVVNSITIITQKNLMSCRISYIEILGAAGIDR